MANISRPISPLLVADEQHLAEDSGDVVAQRGTNPAMVVKCGWAVAGQGDEGGDVRAGAFDVAAA